VPDPRPYFEEIGFADDRYGLDLMCENATLDVTADGCQTNAVGGNVITANLISAYLSSLQRNLS